MQARILIVDDEREIRSVLRKILESCGYDCEEAADALAALNIIHNQHIDLVLTDYQMPTMDGLQFLKRLSDQPGSPPVPVIMMTGSGDDQLEARALQAGAVAIFSKPLNFGDFVTAVTQVISKSQKLEPCSCGEK